MCYAQLRGVFACFSAFVFSRINNIVMPLIAVNFPFSFLLLIEHPEWNAVYKGKEGEL